MSRTLAQLVPYQRIGSPRCNVATTERRITGAAGLAIAAAGIVQLVRERAADLERREGLQTREGENGSHRKAAALGIALGGALVARAAGGFCPIYALIGRGSADAKWRAKTDTPTSRALSGNRGFRVQEQATIDKPAADVYAFWRHFENLPRFMRHLESVRSVDARRSHWVARGPAGSSVEWDAEIVNEEPGKVIGWRTLPDADVVSAGSVNFDEARGGRSTIVTVSLQYQPPGGAIGAAVARWFGEEPSQQIREDLARLKELLESSNR